MVSLPPAMQPNAQQVHEDLASLFSRTLTFNPDLRAAAPKDAPRQEPPLSLASPPSSPSQPIVYSISQHYHHSAHIAKPVPQQQEAPAHEQPQRPSSEPPQSDFSPSETVLRHYGIDVVTLTPSQLQLFRIADEAQKLRLIELWSICPPTRGEEIPTLAWSSTTLEHEEHLARMRFDRQQHTQVMSLDGTQVQTADGRWARQPPSDSEPYMASGYEELMRRESERNETANRPTDVYCHFGTAIGGPSYTPATDPVYMGPDYARQQQHLNMAAQYGAFERFRSAAELDAMDVM